MLTAVPAVTKGVLLELCAMKVARTVLKGGKTEMSYLSQQKDAGSNPKVNGFGLPEGASLQVLISILLPGFMQLLVSPCLPGLRPLNHTACPLI